MPRSSDQLTKDFGSAAPKIQILPSHIDHEADNHYVEAHVFNYDDLGNNWSENLTMRIDEREVQIFECKPRRSFPEGEELPAPALDADRQLPGLPREERR